VLDLRLKTTFIRGAAQCRTLEDLILAIGLRVILANATENRVVKLEFKVRHSAAL
jgi:hypothetical protein